MTAYYNEIDRNVAAWLRELILAGVIAPGDVDERSIVDVQPADLVGYTQCHFFAGVGVWSYALRLAGWPDDRPVWTGSCPCQPFSGAGKGEGFDDPRHLWPAWFRLIRVSRPRIVRQHRSHVVFGEQVERAVRHGWLDVVSADMEGEGYAIGAAVLGAHSVGAPHIRQRAYFVADASSGEGGVYAGQWRSDATATDAGRRGAVGELADTDGNGGGSARECRAEGGRSSISAERSDADGRRAVGAMANAAGRGRDPRSVGRPPREADREGQRQLGTDDGGVVVDAESGGRRVVGDAACEGSRGHADGAGVSGLLGFAGFAGLEGHAGNVNSRNESGRFGADATRPTATASPVSGFWSDAEWIDCTDGKARPVEPGTFPLAHGAPARVVRLRGYGNAIVAQAAEAFIRAYLDVRGG